jgi:hypothetical protein
MRESRDTSLEGAVEGAAITNLIHAVEVAIVVRIVAVEEHKSVNPRKMEKRVLIYTYI